MDELLFTSKCEKNIRVLHSHLNLQFVSSREFSLQIHCELP